MIRQLKLIHSITLNIHSFQSQHSRRLVVFAQIEKKNKNNSFYLYKRYLFPHPCLSVCPICPSPNSFSSELRNNKDKSEEIGWTLFWSRRSRENMKNNEGFFKMHLSVFFSLRNKFGWKKGKGNWKVCWEKKLLKYVI